MSLEDHWNAGRVPAEIATGEWDAVVMQQGPSALPESQVNLREWAERLAELAREHGTRPALLTVWPEGYRVNALGDVIASYANAAKAAGAELYPAGLAWQAGVEPQRRACRSTGRTASTRARSARTSRRSSSPPD